MKQEERINRPRYKLRPIFTNRENKINIFEKKMGKGGRPLIKVI
jgi:hypothetical protein